MTRVGSLLSSILLAAMIALPLLACNSSEAIESEAIEPPFSNILPQNVDVAPNFWFENTRMGSWHTENGIIQHYERTFKGNGVKFWADILVFANGESASTFVKSLSYEGYFTTKHYNDLPSSVVQSKPDESMVWMIESKPTYIEGDEDEHGAESYGVYFRVGRYVGRYSVTHFFPNFPSYADYLEYGSPRGFACLMNLFMAVDDGINGLQTIAD